LIDEFLDAPMPKIKARWSDELTFDAIYARMIPVPAWPKPIEASQIEKPASL